MSRQIVTVPRSIAASTRFTWDIDWRGQSPGESMTGATPIVYNAAPRWVGKPVLGLNKDAILQWRAIRAQAQGRALAYRFPMIDPLGDRAAHSVAAQSWIGSGVPFATGASFSTGAGFAYAPSARLVNAAPAGATSMTIDVTGAPRAPYVGQMLSHDNWPFVVTSVTAATVADHYDLTVQMPLRKAIAADEPISYFASGIFVAADDLTGAPQYERRMRSRPEMSLVEYITR